MDSDSSEGERSTKRRKLNNDHVDNVMESVEEVPKILSPEIHDVFHIFASMLDIKSFMNLAMTSKEMYKRCMENKAVRISVDGDRYDQDCFYNFQSDSVSISNIDSYVAALRKLSCNVSLSRVGIICETNTEYLKEGRKFLKEIGVKRIEELFLEFDDNFTDSEAVVSFVKDFDVSSLHICEPPENDALLLLLGPILQLNLKKLGCTDPVPIDLILQMESSIPELFFLEVDNISKEQLEQILSKIQTGSLRRLTVDFDAVNWDNYDKLPFDHKGPLPEDRPLLFARNADEIDEYWFLHWNGGVTKIVTGRNYMNSWEIFKCEPWELPCALRKNEDILKDLAEKRTRISCSAEQFHNFAGFTMLDPSHKGSLPSARPLYCKANEYGFWMLDEDENLMKCCWEEGSATWKSFNPDEPKVIEIDHSVMAKHMFWKVLKKVGKRTILHYFCNGPKELDSWLEDFQILDFDYAGTLPSTRPLIFQRVSTEREEKHLRVVLLEDRLVECEFSIDTVKINICHCLNYPPILVTASILVEILKDPNHKNMIFNISFDVFRDGLELLKRSIVVLLKRLLIGEKTKTEFWYRNTGVVWKVEWKVEWEDGRISIAKTDLQESPPLFLKQVFRCLVEERSKSSFTLELEQFRECLEQFTVVSFDYSGPLTADPHLIFVKNEICHTCYQKATCQCLEVSSVHVWFLLEDGLRLRKCSWEMNGPKKVQFEPPTSDFMTEVEVPVMLQSTEYLKNLLEAKYDKSSQFLWFGLTDDFFAFFKDYVKLPFKFNGHLLKKRPLLFENSLADKDIAYFLLREDGTIIHCVLQGSYVSFSSSEGAYDVPPALRNFH